MTADMLPKSFFDAVLIAIGAWKSSKMYCTGEDAEGVFGGIDFLREVSLGNTPDIDTNHHLDTLLGEFYRRGQYQKIEQYHNQCVDKHRCCSTYYFLFRKLFHHLLSGRRVASTILYLFSFAILSTLTTSL